MLQVRMYNLQIRFRQFKEQKNAKNILNGLN